MSISYYIPIHRNDLNLYQISVMIGNMFNEFDAGAAEMANGIIPTISIDITAKQMI